MSKISREKFETALNLLDRAAEAFENEAPDETWFRDWFTLIGEHMVCTEEGWQPGSLKAGLVEEYGSDYIVDEVNAPPTAKVSALAVAAVQSSRRKRE